MTSRWTTHEIAMTATRVVKRFRSCGNGEHERECRALSLLHRYAPDLAPAPLCADLTAEPPVVVMSRASASASSTSRTLAAVTRVRAGGNR